MNLLTSINVDFDDSGIVISDTVTMCYGVGPDFVEALYDYCETVLEWHAMTVEPSDESDLAEGLPFADE